MKILVVSLAGIGDTTFATPLIHELRANFPDATIDALVMYGASRDLLANNPYVNRVHFKHLISAGLVNGVRFLAGLRSERYDFSINVHPQSRTQYRVAARIVGAQRRFSHGYECSGAFDRWLMTDTIPQDYARHAVENNLAFLPLLGGKTRLAEHHLEIFLTPEEERWAEEFLAANQLTGRPWLGVHVGSGGTKNLALRRWPVEKYIDLAQRVRGELGLPVLFFGGPEEVPLHANIRAALPSAIFPATKNLRETAALVRHARGFLSVDTALMHIAAAMRVPVQVVIETPTWNPPIHPYGNPFTLVPNPAIQGRHLDFYRYDGRDIQGTREEIVAMMDAVSVEAVFDRIKPVI